MYSFANAHQTGWSLCKCRPQEVIIRLCTVCIWNTVYYNTWCLSPLVYLMVVILAKCMFCSSSSCLRLSIFSFFFSSSLSLIVCLIIDRWPNKMNNHYHIKSPITAFSSLDFVLRGFHNLPELLYWFLVYPYLIWNMNILEIALCD